MGTTESTELDWQVVVSQRLALADLLAGLSAADWERPSLCAGWRVRDVAAHVTLIAVPPSSGTLLIDFAKAHGSYARFNTVVSRRRAERPPTDIVRDLRTTAESHRVPWLVDPDTVLWDLLVHVQDMAIPLGIDVATPAPAGAAAAQRIWELRWPFSFGARQRLGSFTLRATDADWSVGTGPEIVGPISAMLLLLTGRTQAAAPLLAGDGARSLGSFGAG